MGLPAMAWESAKSWMTAARSVDLPHPNGPCISKTGLTCTGTPISLKLCRRRSHRSSGSKLSSTDQRIIKLQQNMGKLPFIKSRARLTSDIVLAIERTEGC